MSDSHDHPRPPSLTTSTLYPPLRSKQELIERIEALRGDPHGTFELVRSLEASPLCTFPDEHYKHP